MTKKTLDLRTRVKSAFSTFVQAAFPFFPSLSPNALPQTPLPRFGIDHAPATTTPIPWLRCFPRDPPDHHMVFFSPSFGCRVSVLGFPLKAKPRGLLLFPDLT